MLTIPPPGIHARVRCGPSSNLHAAGRERATHASNRLSDLGEQVLRAEPHRRVPAVPASLTRLVDQHEAVSGKAGVHTLAEGAVLLEDGAELAADQVEVDRTFIEAARRPSPARATVDNDGLGPPGRSQEGNDDD